MRRFVIVLALLSTPARADDWWGPDKALHLGVSVGLGAAAYSIGALSSEQQLDRLAAGVLGALTAGVLKEVADGLGLGQPSLKDLTWDLIGSTAGALAAWVIDRFLVTPLLEAFAPLFAG